jgi:hypothetical protein
VTVYDIIVDAIRTKKQVFATYQGHARELCPHVLGAKNGKHQVLCYQFGGSSSKGPVVTGSAQNWRCLRLDELSDVMSAEGPWHCVSPHTRPQTCIDDIHVEVTP